MSQAFVWNEPYRRSPCPPIGLIVLPLFFYWHTYAKIDSRIAICWTVNSLRINFSALAQLCQWDMHCILRLGVAGSHKNLLKVTQCLFLYLGVFSSIENWLALYPAMMKLKGLPFKSQIPYGKFGPWGPFLSFSKMNKAIEIPPNFLLPCKIPFRGKSSKIVTSCRTWYENNFLFGIINCTVHNLSHHLHTASVSYCPICKSL